MTGRTVTEAELEVMRQLARARAEFQLRAIKAILVERQERLGPEFEDAIFSNLDGLYEGDET